MKVKKKDLRKRLPQLPINYPAPDVAVPFNYEREKDRVETICKRLAEVEESVRDEVLGRLPQYLKEITQRYMVSVGVDANATNNGSSKALMSKIDEEQLSMIFLKVSYGLFYNYWHSDKPLVQHECAQKIVDLQHAIPNVQAADLFVRCFLRILVREWMKIDKWRLDKYMSLVRKLVFQTFRRLVNLGESTPEAVAATARVMEAFQQEVILESAVGLTMHICDVILEELTRSQCGDELFVRIIEGIPLFAMRRGNYVEKRVLDFVISPLAAGLLDESRDTKAVAAAAAVAATRGQPRKVVEYDNNTVLLRIAALCEEASVGKGTAYLVRPMLSEASLLLKRAVEVKKNPDAFEVVHKRDRRLRLEKEIEEAEETRMLRGAAKSASKDKKSSKGGKQTSGGSSRTKKILPVGKVMKVKGIKKKVGANAKSSKRKKIVKLSMKDLVSHDSDDE